MSQQNVEVVRGCLDGWNRGDRDAWLRTAHPDIEWESEIARRLQGDETVYRGEAGLRRFWDEWRSVWDVRIEISETHDLGESVLVVGRIETRGEASGVGLGGPVAYLFEFEGGLARRVRAYLEVENAFEDAGLSQGVEGQRPGK